MSLIKLQGNASGTGAFTIAAPNSNTDRTLTLPDATGTVVLQGGALTRGTAVASTSGTSIDFTGIPSWAKRITVMLDYVSTSGTSVIQIRLGDSGGVEATGYATAVSLIAGTDNTTRSTLYTTGFPVVWSVAAGSSIIAMVTFVNVNNNLWIGSGLVSDSTGAGTTFVSGSKTLSDTLDRVRITTVNGTDTFDAGTINIMYEG